MLHSSHEPIIDSFDVIHQRPPMHRPVESRRFHRAALLTLGFVTVASVATLRSFSIAEARSASDVPGQARKPVSKAAKPAAKSATKAKTTSSAQPAAQGPDGRVVYSTTCAACHQATGEGVEGTYPPLAGSEIVNGDEAKVVRIVLHGLTGPVEVAGETYSGMMPPWGGVLKDPELAAVLTYVRSAWGNKAAPITPGKVAAIRAATTSRATPWTAAELAGVK
jgi:mono/diheme cytochrome c family protein